jgi:hypothetical protein
MWKIIKNFINTINNLWIQSYEKQYNWEKLFKVRYKNEWNNGITKKISKTLNWNMRKASWIIYNK